MTAENQVFSAFSFLSFVLTAIPFTWHLQAWNTGACMFMGWVSLCSLILFINSVVWNGSVADRAPIYCDIVTKILVGASVAIPAVVLSISRHLYHAISISAVTKTTSEKRRGMLIDLVIGVGIPITIMILHVVVQRYRYDIFEDVGCWPTIANTALAYVLVLTPPLGLALIALVYVGFCTIALKRNYVGVKEILLISVDQVTPSRYIRLLCLAGVQASFNILIHLYVIVTYATKDHVEPWISWKDTHSNFNRFEAFSATMWRNDKQEAIALERVRWTIVTSGLLFFALFGFASEATQNYKRVYSFFVRRLAPKPGSIPQSLSSTGQTPSSAWFYGNWSGQSDSTLGHSGGFDTNEKEGGALKSSTNRFDVFARKIRLAVFRPPTSGATFSRQSTLNNDGHSTISGSSEMTEQRREFSMDADAMSAFTQFTDFTGSTIPGFFIEGAQQTTRPISALRRRSSYIGSDVNDDNEKSEPERIDSDDDDDDDSTVRSEVHTSIADSISVYSQPSPLYPSSPVPPPIPPKDLVYASPTAKLSPFLGNLTIPPSAFLQPQSYYQRDFILLASSLGGGSSSGQNRQQQQRQQQQYHLPQRRTPPKQGIPISVSASPTPSGSFLDLRASVGSELSHVANSRV